MASHENYQRVKELIEKRRQDALALADSHALELRAQSREIAEIDGELEGTGLKIFRAACRGEDLSTLRERNTALQERRREIITFLGYPADYTEVHYTCKKCSDTGFIDGVKMCSCFKEALAMENIKSSGLGRLIEKQSFESFDIERYKDDEVLYGRMKYNLETAQRFVRDFGKDVFDMVLAGFTGTGKTHLTTAVARELIARGYEVVYDTAQNIISDFEQDRFRSGYGQSEPKSTKYLECELLIIDDLGAEFVNQFSISCLYNILNTRLNRSLPTVITTNLNPTDIEKKYDGRIFSRVMNRSNEILYFTGPDQRMT